MSSCAAESEVDITAADDEVDANGWHIFGRECPKEEIVFLLSGDHLVHGHRG